MTELGRGVPTSNTGNWLKDALVRKFYYFWDTHVWPDFNIEDHRKAFYEKMGEVMSIQEGEKVLEIGANKPLWREYSRKVGNTGLFVSLDVYKEIQQRTKKTLKAEALQNGKESFSEKLLTANAHKLPFSDEAFDVIIAGNFTDIFPPMMDEAIRVLKPEGRMGISFTDDDMIKKYKKICISKGLEVSPIIAHANPKNQKLGDWIITVRKSGHNGK